VKYSEASKIKVTGVANQNGVFFEVSDNGKGMDITKVKSGHGLNNMKKRATEINGTFELTSEPGKGTTCRLMVPLN
jgi:signal transduction histidine kinase